MILGILIVVHEFGHFIVAKKLGVRVEKFSLGFGPALWRKKIGDTEYCICAVPLGGYVKPSGDSLEEYKKKPYEFLAKSPGERAKIILAGPLLNYILGFLCFWLVFFVGYPTLTSKVGGLVDGFGAKDAGLKIGDKIVAIDGVKVDYWEDLQNIIHSKANLAVVQLSVLRGNKEETVKVVLKQKELADLLGQKRSVSLLGITPSEEFVKVRHGPIAAMVLGVKHTWDLTVTVYKAFGLMVVRKLSIKEATGPVGMFFITSKIAKQGLIALINFIGIISVHLAIFNLLPLPLLDGGHLVLLAAEKARGKNIGIKAERVITQVGFTMIIALALVITYNDIVRFFGERIAKFFR